MYIKKPLCVLLSSSVIFSAGICALAERDISVLLDGTKIEFDVQPQIINERTMVPLRAIFEALGAEVGWNGDTRTVTASKDNITISLKIDSDIMYVNDEAVTLDSPATIVDDRTLVPVRAISEAFGTDVDWDDETSTVTILTKAADLIKETGELIRETAEAVKSQITNKINTIKGSGGSGGSKGSSGGGSSAVVPSPTPAATPNSDPDTIDTGLNSSSAETSLGFDALAQWLTENGSKNGENQFSVSHKPSVDLIQKFGVTLYDMECFVTYDKDKNTISMSAKELDNEEPLSFDLVFTKGEDTVLCNIDYKGFVSSGSFSPKEFTRDTEKIDFNNFPSAYTSDLIEFYSQMYTSIIKEMTYAMNLTLKVNDCALRTTDLGFNSMDQ